MCTAPAGWAWMGGNEQMCAVPAEGPDRRCRSHPPTGRCVVKAQVTCWCGDSDREVNVTLDPSVRVRVRREMAHRAAAWIASDGELAFDTARFPWCDIRCATCSATFVLVPASAWLGNQYDVDDLRAKYPLGHVQGVEVPPDLVTEDFTVTCVVSAFGAQWRFKFPDRVRSWFPYLFSSTLDLAGRDDLVDLVKAGGAEALQVVIACGGHESLRMAGVAGGVRDGSGRQPVGVGRHRKLVRATGRGVTDHSIEPPATWLR